MSRSKWREHPYFADNKGVQAAIQVCDYAQFYDGAYEFEDHHGVIRQSRGFVHGTFAIVHCPGDIRVVGMAFWDEDNVPSKKVGREIALGRAESHIADLLGVRASCSVPVRSFEDEEEFDNWLRRCRNASAEDLSVVSLISYDVSMNE